MKASLILIILIFINFQAYAQWHDDVLSQHNYTSKPLKKSPNLKWSFLAEGRIYGPAVKAKNVLFGDTKGYVYSIDSKKGQLNWKFKTEGQILGCPSVKDSLAYVGSYDGYLYCLTLKKGELVWKFKTGSGASCSPPLVKDDKVYFGSHDKFFYVVNRFTGEEINKRNIGHGNCSTPTHENGLVYITDWGGKYSFFKYF